MDDDQRFDYVYKFVSHERFDPGDREANRDLLDSGTLFVARFDADASLAWIPLVFGSRPLTPGNGFQSQADVLIEARRAADLLGATPMDRPEDVQPNPATGRVYLMLTNNSKRKADDTNAPNPRGPNPYGHIIEMVPPAGDHGALEYRWSFLVLCGNPKDPGAKSKWGAATSPNGWFEAPDNAAVDGFGRLWIATDGNKAGSHSNRSDGLWAMETEGAPRGTARHFFPRACRGRAVRPPVHPRHADAVRRRAASGRRRRRDVATVRPRVELRGPGHPLARLRARHAAQALGRGRHQKGRRRHRRLTGGGPLSRQVPPNVVPYPIRRPCAFIRPGAPGAAGASPAL